MRQQSQTRKRHKPIILPQRTTCSVYCSYDLCLYNLVLKTQLSASEKDEPYSISCISEAPFSVNSNMQKIVLATLPACVDFPVPKRGSEVLCWLCFPFCPVFECFDLSFSFYSFLPFIQVTRCSFIRGRASSLHYTNNLQVSIIVHSENSKNQTKI